MNVESKESYQTALMCRLDMPRTANILIRLLDVKQFKNSKTAITRTPMARLPLLIRTRF